MILQTLPVAELAQRCTEETMRYQRREEHDPRYCYELFRLAIVHQNKEAWTALYDQYHHLVCHWQAGIGGGVGGLVNEAFERFWMAVPAGRFADFPTLDRILAYLKRCAQSVVLDAKRKKEREQVQESTLDRLQEITEGKSHASSVEQVLNGIVGEQLHDYALRSLNSPQEQLVFRATFEWNLEPRMIAERWPSHFSDARQVSRIKERICRRLQRDKEFKVLLGRPDDDGGES